MSLAENLLNTLSTDEAVGGGLIEEPHIVVNESRQIIVPAELRNIAVTGDKDIETVVIDCARYWDGHDLSEFSIYLSYVLPNGDEGTYLPSVLSTFDNYFSFSWTIGKHLTQYSGNLTISIIAIDVDTEGNEIRRWGSFPNSEMNIVRGLNVAEVPSDPEAQDVLSQLIKIVNETNQDVESALDRIIEIQESLIGGGSV